MVFNFFLDLLFFLIGMLNVVSGQSHVLALFIFGNFVLDVGYNNYLYTIVKSNFLPFMEETLKITFQPEVSAMESLP